MFTKLAKSLKASIGANSSIDIKAKLKFKGNGAKSKNFTLNVFDGPSGEKLQKLRVRNSQLDKANYFGEKKTERTDDFDEGNLVGLKQRDANGERSGSEIRLRKGEYQHRYAETKERWTDVKIEDLQNQKDQVKLLAGPSIGEHTDLSKLFLEFVKDEALEELLSNKIVIRITSEEIVLFVRKNDKHAFSIADLDKEDVEEKPQDEILAQVDDDDDEEFSED